MNNAPNGSANSRFVYTYDTVGRRIGMVTLDGTWTYTYDLSGQLIRAVFASINPNIPNQDLNYEYDALGNRVRTILNGTTTDYTTNALNQFTAVGGTTYRYDLDGNLVEETEPKFGFGDTVVKVSDGRQYYFAAVSMTFNGKAFDVEVELSFDSTTGQIRAVFQSIDPGTELPPDVLTGFLPPEDGTGRGKGYIAYTARPKAGLPTGTQIRNVALISFDRQTVIATNQIDPLNPAAGTSPAKEALNTIDSGTPTSSVAALPATVSTPSFTVSWSGTDDTGGSGIAFFDVYVSDNSSAFLPFLTRSTLTSATFTGVAGHTYGFYSVATDNVGNRQPTPAGAQATTTVTSGAAATTTTVSPSVSSAEYGQSVTFTALVTSSGNPVTVGTVTFREGSTVLANNVALDASGRASFATSLLPVAGSPHTITATYNGSTSFATSSGNTSLTVTRARLTVTADNKSRLYGDANPTFTASYSGFKNSETLATSGVTGSPSLTTTATLTSPVANYPITAALGSLAAGNYDFTFINGTLTVNPAPLSATGLNFTATAGAPFTGLVATFTNADPFGNASSYTASIAWGDGSTTAGVIALAPGTTVLIVTETYAYPDPGSKTVRVTISHKLGYTTSPTTTGTATVNSLNQGIAANQSASINFWNGSQGQALINSFNGSSTATALSAWLAANFPNLYGANAGANNLTGKTNAQVAAFYQTLFSLQSSKLDAEVLATALNVYATTQSLGGAAGQANGFAVSATGLGARSVNVGANWVAFAVANNTTLNVWQILKRANQQAVNGVLYNGILTLRQQACNVFNSINLVGGR